MDENVIVGKLLDQVIQDVLTPGRAEVRTEMGAIIIKEVGYRKDPTKLPKDYKWQILDDEVWKMARIYSTMHLIGA